MINWYEAARHWTPQEGYATGDVLLDLLRDGWQVARLERAPQTGRALLYDARLERGRERLVVPVLDCPAVRDIRRMMN